MKTEILEVLQAIEDGKIKRKSLISKLTNDDGKFDEMSFERSINSLVKKGRIVVDDKYITLCEIEESEGKRKRVDNEDNAENEDVPAKVAKNDTKGNAKNANNKKDTFELWKNGEQAWRDNTLEFDYLADNPDKITRLFCGNLNKNITEEQLKEHLPGITYIKWIRDKETGDFYGTTFLEMADGKSAASAVLKDRTKYLGRQLKIYYCPPKPGDIWPPIGGNSAIKPTNVSSSSGAGAGVIRRDKAPKPPNARKLFMGNLSYNIDDDTIVEFFKECGGEIVGLRWLTHKDSGEFKGCGYIEFDNTEVADKALTYDGAMVLGRPIRLDWG